MEGSKSLTRRRLTMKKSLATTPTELQPLPLADMTVPQLGQAFAQLDDARTRYDRLSGICGTLQGLVLLEVKRKVGHGGYGKWLQDNFPKSQDSANRCTRVAEEFLRRLQTRNTPESKFRTRAEFTATQLLLGDLASNLSAIESAKLDMSHPVVEAVSAYVDGRSFRQLLLDLGPASFGGDTRKIDPATGKPVAHPRKPLDVQLELRTEAAKAHCKNVCLGLSQLLEDRRIGFDLLPEDMQECLRDALRDYSKLLKDIRP